MDHVFGLFSTRLTFSVFQDEYFEEDDLNDVYILQCTYEEYLRQEYVLVLIFFPT